jgi:hypothetical protein
MCELASGGQRVELPARRRVWRSLRSSEDLSLEETHERRSWPSFQAGSEVLGLELGLWLGVEEVQRAAERKAV